MKKQKKNLLIIIPIVAFVLAFIGVFFYFNSVDKKTNFSLK